MKKILALMIPLFLLGCETMAPKPEIIEVKVPVITVPAPPITIRPDLQIQSVSIDKDGVSVYIKTLESDMVKIKYYAYSLEQVINTYYELSVLSNNANNK